LVTGLIYLLINLLISRLVMLLEYRLTPHLRAQPAVTIKKPLGELH